MTRPRVLTKCVADRYASKNERIIEISHNGVGCLVSLWAADDGRLLLNVYRCHRAVEVSVEHGIQVRKGERP